MDKEKGFVYILTNQSFKDNYVKIGSTKNIKERLKQLDNTSIPLPFEIYASIKTSKYIALENSLHTLIEDLRIRPNREFFLISPSKAFKKLEKLSNLIDDSELYLYDENRKPILQNKKKENNKQLFNDNKEKNKKQRRPDFRFNMVNIKIGEYIVFEPLDITVKVVSEEKIEYKGKLWSLSGFTANYMPLKRQKPSKAYQGSSYFLYNGKKLSVLRDEIEKKQNKL